MNLQEMHDEIHEYLKECERNALSPDNLGGDRYCAGTIRGAFLCLHLAKAVHSPQRLIVELFKLRDQEATRWGSDTPIGRDYYLTGILYSIDEVLHIAQSYADAPPTFRGHSTTPYADIRSRA
jgi:hypothetical protein